MLAIQAEGVTKSYGSLTAVEDFHLEISRGEIFCLLGPNGAGKTTTLEILEGLRQPDAGKVWILGHDLRRDYSEIQQQIGVQLQSSSFYPKLRVWEVLDQFGGYYHRHLSVDQLLQMTSLSEKREALIERLSGGQQQRLSLAVTMVNDPELIFLDEPTAGLDPQSRRQLWKLIRSLKARGKTILMTTHYLEEAEALADRVGIIDHGRQVALGTPDQLRGRAETLEDYFLELTGEEVRI